MSDDFVPHVKVTFSCPAVIFDRLKEVAEQENRPYSHIIVSRLLPALGLKKSDIVINAANRPSLKDS